MQNNSTKQYQKQQEAKRLQGRFFPFIRDYHLGTLLNRSGIRTLKVTSPLKLFSAIFVLSFEGNNFFRRIVADTDLPFRKNTAYKLLKNPPHNWRTFLLSLAVQVAKIKKKMVLTAISTHEPSFPQKDLRM